MNSSLTRKILICVVLAAALLLRVRVRRGQDNQLADVDNAEPRPGLLRTGRHGL